MDIRSYTLEELYEQYSPRFRAEQLFDWLHVKQVTSSEQMSNFPKQMRPEIVPLELVTVQTSKQDGTQKYLFALPDGNAVESVFMRYHHGNSVCISSQVGCAMGCRFCASTIGGRIRNLEAWEMLDQIYRIQAITEERVSNVVVMGTGEPLDNYENLIRFLKIITDPKGANLSARNITVSTCGIVPNMRNLMRERLPITLALSLHASNQDKRMELMPIAKKYPLDEVLAACDEYYAYTGRRITYEYALVHGVNDTEADAKELISLLGGKNCHMNLIPVNPVTERNFERPTRQAAEAFQKRLIKGGINATIRRELGTDIDGACGQLRKRHTEQGSKDAQNILQNGRGEEA